MSVDVFELLRLSGFVRNNKANMRAIQSAPPGKILDLCEHIKEKTIEKHNDIKCNDFLHSASMSLSGGRSRCVSYRCRKNNIIKMEQFAALYSDKVYSYNFLADYDYTANTVYGSEINYSFYDDIRLLLSLEPLVESENIQLFHFEGLCPHCTYKNVITNTTKEKVDKLENDFSKAFYKEVSFCLVNDDGYFSIELHGPESILFPHGDSCMSVGEGMLQDLIDIAPNVVDRAFRHGSARLPKTIARQLSIGEGYASSYIHDILFELGTANLKNAAYLCDNEYEIASIRRLTSDPVAQKCSILLAKHLECILPFVRTTNPTDLLSIRNNDYDSFITFRRSFEKAITEYVGNADDMNEKTAAMIYQDVVRPEISRLNTILNNANRCLNNDINRKMIAWTLSLCAGIIGGVISQPLVASLGGYNVLNTTASMIQDYLKTKDAESSIRNDSFYFLWKLKQSANVSRT